MSGGQGDEKSDPHPFDVATALTATGEPDVFTGRTHPAYANMVGPFGGITAAVMASAVLEHPARLGELTAVTVNFAGPVQEGDYRLIARPVRTNRSSQHWIVEQWQGDSLATSATAVTALRRGAFESTEHLAPSVPGPQELTPVRYPPMLAWPDRYEMRFASGMLEPGAAPAPESESVLWVRDSPRRALDVRSLVALCDVFFPRAFLRTGQFAPAGTVTFTAYMHAAPEDLAAHGDDFVLGRAVGQRFAGGYFDQSAALWAPSGELLASSHQLVYFKS